MIVRKAKVEDAARIVPCLFLAMKDFVYKFIGESNPIKANAFLLYFVEKKQNQYSYQNCWVIEDNGEILGAVNVYDGAQLDVLRKPVTQYVKQQFKKNAGIEDETEAGEYYIDSLGVSPNQQGKGIGSALLRFLINEHVCQHQQTLGLLVDEENPKAKKLYLKLGFKPVGKKLLMGKNMEHLQIG